MKNTFVTKLALHSALVFACTNLFGQTASVLPGSACHTFNNNDWASFSWEGILNPERDNQWVSCPIPRTQLSSNAYLLAEVRVDKQVGGDIQCWWDARTSDGRAGYYQGARAQGLSFAIASFDSPGAYTNGTLHISCQLNGQFDDLISYMWVERFAR